MASNRSYPQMLNQKPAAKSVMKDTKKKESPWMGMMKKNKENC